MIGKGESGKLLFPKQTVSLEKQFAKSYIFRVKGSFRLQEKGSSRALPARSTPTSTPVY